MKRKQLAFIKRSVVATLFSLFCLNVQSQVIVVATAGTPGPTPYPNLGAAFAAINAGTHQGNIAVGIASNTTETGPCVLNSSGAGAASYTGVAIGPSVDGVTVSGATTTGRGLIELKGADNVIIEGDNPNTPGTNRNLTITNTAANTITYTSCIRICNAATVVTSSDNITIRNCILNGSATGRNVAGVTSTTGSENTTFGIYVGGNGGTTAVDAPTAITSVTTNSSPAGTTVNNFIATNNAIASCARGIVFNGANAAVSTGISITDNVLGTSGTLAGAPPFTAITSTIYTKGIWIAGTTALTVTGNTIQNQLSYVATLMTSIELNAGIGAGVITISNNTINGLCNNNATANAVKAILVSNAGAAYTVSGNQITNVQGILTGFAAGTTTVGIEINSTGGAGTIERNKITQVYNRNAGTTAAYGINILGGNNHIIRNNFISDLNQNMSGGFSFDPQYCVAGIRVNAGTGHQIYYNSINLAGTLLGTAASDLLTAGIAVASTTNTGLDIRNNSISNTLSGGTTNLAHVSLYLPSGGTSAMNLTLNNNAYFSGSTAVQGIAQTGTTFGTGFYTAANFIPGATAPASNLRSYTSTLSVAGTNDNASVASTAAAPYVSLSDLHINNSAPTAILLDGTATPIGSVTTDIDAAARNATTPDIGAHEFVTPSCSSANGGTIAPTTYTICDGQTVSLTSTGATTGLGITYQWKVATVSGGPYSNVSGGTGATTTSYISGTLSAGTYYYVLETTCSFGPLVGNSNEVTVTVNALPVVAVSPTSALYCNPGTAVTLTASGATSYAWSPASGLSAVTGASVDASPISTTVYTVTGTDANGCVANTTTTITSGTSVTGATASASLPTICDGGSVDLMSSANPYVQVLLNENFNSGAPAWTRVNASTGGTPANAAWTDRPNGYVYGGGTAYQSNDNSGFVMSNSDSQGSGSTTNTLLVSPAFSTAGYSGMVLNYYQYYRDIADAGDSAVVEFSNDGTNWTIAGSYVATAGSENAFALATINVPVAFENQPTVYVRFRYRATWDWYWSIDNVSITANSSNFTYSWTSTPSGFTSTDQNPLGVAPTATTTYDVTITNLSGCSATASTSVTVNPLPSVVANATASAVCDGDPVTLTGSGATSYAWDNSVTDGVAFNPTATTTYTVTGTDGNGCQNTDAITVTVDTLPVVVANATTTILCESDPVTLTGSGATSYSWDNSVTDGVAFNPSATTTYTVTGTDGNGCQNTDAITVTVNTLPIVVASSTASTVCESDPVTLTGSGATSYSWDNGVTDGVVFNPTATATYTVTGTDTNGCINSDVITVTVNPLPTVTANATASSICEGDAVTLTGSGASSYSWDNGVTDGVAFNPTTTTSYTVTGMDGNGCENTDAVTVTVNTLPTATATDNGDATITASSGASYQWINCGTGLAIAGATSQTFTASANGDYAVVVTNAGNCSDTSACVTIDYIGVNELAADASIQVYPNPTSGEVFVTMSSAIATIQVIDAQGKTLQTTTVANGDKVLLTSYETGVYFLRIVTENGSSLERIVKQ